MARKSRVEIEGGLYHIITRGNNRQLIFGSDDNYLKLLSLLGRQKAKLRFSYTAIRLSTRMVTGLWKKASKKFIITRSPRGGGGGASQGGR